MSEAQLHVPVMLNEVLSALAVRDQGVFVDGTLGAGGYTRAILEAAPSVRVVGIDRDPWAVRNGKSLGERVNVIHGCFGNMDDLVGGEGFRRVDGVVLDIGVSSVQIDQPERGFSFRFDGPLDMRMDSSSAGRTAADIVNEDDEAVLADIFFLYGQERYARRVASAIVRERATEEIRTTGRLAGIVRSVVPKSKGDALDPATRTFQALRIAVNDELGELRRGLVAAERILMPGGRLVVVTFHSLEDGIVKDFLVGRSGKRGGVSRHMPDVPVSVQPTFKLLCRKAVKPSEAECRGNPRARSAKLRAAVRTDVEAGS
ncbi:MAG: 16S rRNA (cytosine(1402)-N(4))-methyltransferase RsmH [Alphaproteobacteria bacterium]|nr:16S rRNA (cytosine(1402)-N(4))-methyltransferase RsmH [Alphaproteobacteria bacterium]